MRFELLGAVALLAAAIAVPASADTLKYYDTTENLSATSTDPTDQIVVSNNLGGSYEYAVIANTLPVSTTCDFASAPLGYCYTYAEVYLFEPGSYDPVTNTATISDIYITATQATPSVTIWQAPLYSDFEGDATFGRADISLGIFETGSL
jgi:hypothetical protein